MVNVCGQNILSSHKHANFVVLVVRARYAVPLTVLTVFQISNFTNN